MNANSKLQHVAPRSDNPLILSSYISNVKIAVDLIFHVPKQIQDLVLPSAQPEFQVPHHPNVGIPGPSNGLGGDEDDSQESDRLDSGSDGQDDDVPEEGHPDSDVDLTEDSDYDDEEDDEPDTINGLTFSEMEMVMQRASDGSIPAQERADAAMLMLGMARGKLSLPHITLLCLSDSES